MRKLASTIALTLALAPALALSQSGMYKKEQGIRIAAGNVPEVAQFGSLYRVYYCGQGGILSAASSDGLNFTLEAGVRIAPGPQGGHEEIVCDPSIIKLAAGAVRMYYKGADGPGGPGQANHRIFSAWSSDGISFTKEGLRWENLGAPDFGWTSVPDAVVTPTGQVRVYYTGGLGIESIISNDGLSFAFEPGTRMQGVDPDVVLKGNGTYRMYYAVGLPAQSLAVAESNDGLAFSPLGTIITAGTTGCDSGATIDPSAIQMPSGRWRVYYGGLGPCGNVTLSALSPMIVRPRIAPVERAGSTSALSRAALR